MAKTKEVVKLTVLEEYRQAVAADPKNAEAHANLGWGLYGEGQWEAAIQEFSVALSLDAGQIDALYGLGLTRKAAGAKPEAVAAFDQALAMLGILEDKTRSLMLTRLARGHINMLRTGHWASSSGIDARR
jgi:tetratricopeptide (TPR) repeat protein